jgi:hypothetical protein
MKTPSAPALFVSLAMAAAVAAHAGEADHSALQREVDALKQMVLELQARVDRLEGHTPTAARAVPAPQALRQPPAARAPAVAQPASQSSERIAAAPPPVVAREYVSPEAALRSNWSRIKQAMAQAEVTRLLGAPTRTLTLDGRTVWYYVYPGIGSGSVFFTDAGHVSSSQSPFGWTW